MKRTHTVTFPLYKAQNRVKQAGGDRVPAYHAGGWVPSPALWKKKKYTKTPSKLVYMV
jgi:hypothetical protein